MNELLQLPLILAVFTFQFYSVGLLFVRKIKLKTLERIILGLVLGLCIYVGLVFLLGFLWGIKAYYLSYLFFFIGILNCRENWHTLKAGYREIVKAKWHFFTISLFSVVYASTTFLTGLKVGDTYIFQEFTDGLWHIALINVLKTSFPPLHPSSFLFNLSGYNYFYDLLIASISKIYLLDSIFLYFRFFPVFIAFLLGSSAYLFLKTTSNSKNALLLTFFIYFTGSFAYLIPLFLPGNSWGESSFWVSQTFGTIVNQQLILSFGILFAILILLRKLDEHCDNFYYHFLICVLISASLGFKSYAFMAFCCLYAIYQIVSYFKTRSVRQILPLVILLLLSTPFYLLMSGKTQKFPFFYQPFWFLDTMVLAPDRLNLVEWKMREDMYWFLGKPVHAMWIKAKEFFVFVFGNLGMRSVFVILLPFVFRYEKRLILSILGTFIILALFPLFFLQNGGVWNSIQFWYYALILANILAVLSLNTLFVKVKHTSLKVIILLIVVGLSLPTFVKFYAGKVSSFRKIDAGFVESLDFKPNSRTLICPRSDFIFNDSFLTAYYDSRNYLSHPGQLQLVGIDPKSIEESLINMLDKGNPTHLKELLSTHNIRYAVCKNENWSKKLESVKSVKSKQIYKEYTVIEYN
jgi:hypothetical protein